MYIVHIILHRIQWYLLLDNFGIRYLNFLAICEPNKLIINSKILFDQIFNIGDVPVWDIAHQKTYNMYLLCQIVLGSRGNVWNGCQSSRARKTRLQVYGTSFHSYLGLLTNIQTDLLLIVCSFSCNTVYINI